jgi:uncharacterized delta-60 repeat protein
MLSSHLWRKLSCYFLPARTARRARPRSRPLGVESLETRQLLSTLVTASADGLVADRNLDYNYDTIDTASAQISDRWLPLTTIGQERPVLEFDLSHLNLAAGTGIVAASLSLDVVSFTSTSNNGVTTDPQFGIRAFASNGSITLAVGTAPATAVGVGSIGATGSQNFSLDAATVNGLVGGMMAVRLENTALNAQWFSFSSTEDTTRPAPHLVLETGPVVTPVAIPPTAGLVGLTIAPASVSESGGSGAATGTVTRFGDLSQPLALSLASSDAGTATVPASVTISAGQASATFPISPVDANLVGGTHAAIVSASGTAAPVGLDQSFGTGGLVRTPLAPVSQFPHAAILRQPDGHILAASEDGGGGWQLIRLNADGSLDTSFGSGGVTYTPLPYQNATNPVPHSIALDPNGKILVGGAYTSYQTTGHGLGALVRYNANGTPDTTFGNQGVANLSSISNPFVDDVVVRPDARVLLGLAENGAVLSRVAQVSSTGTLDTSFGSFGVATLNLGYEADQLVLLSSGEFLVGGAFQTTAGVAEVRASGVGLDTTFGTAGKATVPFAADGVQSVEIAGLALDNQGRIVFGATIDSVSTSSGTYPGRYGVARLTASGAPDTFFNGNGTAILAVASGGSDFATAMAIQPDNKIVLGGLTTINNVRASSLVRFNNDGSPDTSFNGTGAFRQALVSPKVDQIFGISLTPDGRLLALAGWLTDMRVARLNMAAPQPVGAGATLTVLDDDPNLPPVVGNQPFAVTESSSSGTAIGTVVASDPNPGQTLTYALVGGNSGGAFAIDPATGAITVANPAALDAEATPVFTLTVQVTDSYSQPLSTTATISVNVLDVTQPPVVTSTTVTVTEFSTVGTAVGMVSASNPDADDTLTYAISAGNVGGAFAIDPATGAITVATAAALDAETTPVFNLTVTVTDNGDPSLTSSGTITVNVLDVTLPPVVTSATFTLAEQSSNGTAVGTVSASNPDGDDTLVYTVTAGNTGGAFAINPATGAITVQNSAALDFKTTPVFMLTVTASDSGSPSMSGSATLTIRLTQVVQSVSIEVNPSQVKLDHTKTVQVVIFSTVAFDARTVNVDSLRFGHTGTENSLDRNHKGMVQYSYQDVNHDGRLDLVVTFVVDLAGFVAGDTEAYLTGALSDGTPIRGAGPVIVAAKH